MKKIVDEDLPNPLTRLLELFPFLYRHPHPMLVHFPIVFAVSPALFYLFYLITGVTLLRDDRFSLSGGWTLVFYACCPDRLSDLVAQLSSQVNAAGQDQNPYFNAAPGNRSDSLSPEAYPARFGSLPFRGRITLSYSDLGPRSRRIRDRLVWCKSDLSTGETNGIVHQDRFFSCKILG